MDYRVSLVLDETGLENMILAHEGSVYTNHPNDHGGPTKYGITLKVLSVWRGRQCSAEDVRDLTRDEAAKIYNAHYIAPFRLLGATILRANVVDMGVNAGTVRATRLLQQTVGTEVDGKFGRLTLAAAVGRDWNALYTGVRLAFYERIIENDPSQMVWRNGWRNRGLSFHSPVRLKFSGTLGDSIFGHTGKAYLNAA